MISVGRLRYGSDGTGTMYDDQAFVNLNLLSHEWWWWWCFDTGVGRSSEVGWFRLFQRWLFDFQARDDGEFVGSQSICFSFRSRLQIVCLGRFDLIQAVVLICQFVVSSLFGLVGGLSI